MISLYSQLGFVVHPIVKAFIYFRSMKAKEDRTRISERFGISSRPRPDGVLVHIHAVSVGEAMSAKILFDMVRRSIPGSHILLTTGTVTSSMLLEGRLPHYVTHQYYPIDTPQAVNRFISHWNPDLAIWIESEIWPLMLHHLHMNGTKIMLLNGRLSDKSYKTWVKFKSFAKEIFSNFDLVITQGSEKLSRFKSLGAKEGLAFSNIKLLADPMVVDNEEYNHLKNSVKDRKVWLAASTHEGEEELAINVHLELLKKHNDALLFIAPRHVNRAPQIIKMIKDKGIPYGLYSESKLPKQKDKIFIMDQMGKMGELYKISPVTFVGGTYVPKGGHNPIEAAQLGSLVLHGPHTFNNRELYDELHNYKVAYEITSHKDILNHLLKDNKRSGLNWDQIREEKLGSLEKILDEFATNIRGMHV